MLDFSLVLPVFNEEDIIVPVVSKLEKVLHKLKISYELVLVENESTDGSLRVLKSMAKRDQRIRVVETQKGYGSAVIAGIRAAKGEYIGYMPSDGQIDSEIVANLWQEVQTKQYDVVKIYRKNRESRVRSIRSKCFNVLSRILYFPIPVRDINGSPRIVHRDKLQALHLRYKDSFIDTEFAVKARILRWKIKEIPMKNLNRLGGKSTVQFNTVLEFFRNLYSFRRNPQFRQWKKLNKPRK